MIYSYTQISQYLTCPRRYRHRYLDGWQEKDTRAAMLFGRAFLRALAAYFLRQDAAAALLPLLKQGSRCVLAQEIGGQSALKGASEEHGCPGVFLLPTVERAMAVSARAGQVVADLGVAVGHRATPELFGFCAVTADSSSH